MTPFTSEEHILFNSKPIWMIFLVLDAIGVITIKHFLCGIMHVTYFWSKKRTQKNPTIVFWCFWKQQNNDQRSLASNCKLVLLVWAKLQLECSYNLYPILVVIPLKLVNYLFLGALFQKPNGNWDEWKKMFDLKC